MHPLKTSKDPLSGPPETIVAPSEDLQRPLLDDPTTILDLQRPSQAAQDTPYDHSGPFWTILDHPLHSLKTLIHI